jgi:hypothetical protein
MKILVHNNIIVQKQEKMKQKVLKNGLTPAEYQRLPGGEVLGT